MIVDLLPILGMFIVVFVELHYFIRGSSSTAVQVESRFDTPEKAINREKLRYIDGEITLDQYEDRVYQITPVDE